MQRILAEDMRSILTRLEEYMIATEEKGDDNKEAPADDQEDKDGSGGVDDALTEPAGLEKVVGSLNVPALITLLGIPEDQISNFKGGLNALKQENPNPTRAQAMALAMAFDHVLTGSTEDKNKLSGMIKAMHGDEKEKVTETSKMNVLVYNSGYGEKLDAVSNDPKRRKEVNVVQMRFGSQGQPELVWADEHGQKYTADWDQKYGWVADMD